MVSTITGQDASVRWGYRTVARLSGWSLTRTDQGGTVTAQWVDGDELGLEQAPLVLIVPVGQSQWRWPVYGLRREGVRVEVTVGPMEH